ncbi:MAG: hypothetical protein LBH21_02605, partial [Gracilibacteraceae bacterium]|nr:hypothetical protein [Gracilibacteraceae bacterium]
MSVMTIVFVLVGLPALGVIIGAATRKPLVWRLAGTILCFETIFVLGSLWAILAGSPQLLNLFGPSGRILAIAVCGGLFLISLLFIWKPFKVKTRRIAALALAAALLVTTVSAAGVQIYRNSFLQIGDMEIALHRYAPFGDTAQNGEGETLVKTLAGPSALTFTDNLPLLDGATALYPLYSAFARATYPAGDYGPHYMLPGIMADKYYDIPAYAKPAAADAY